LLLLDEFDAAHQPLAANVPDVRMRRQGPP
jgi:hypothetical protein